uniref:Uncharacterized protein n=1 Tax=Leersia perrieri TaxID=77586 RepID=A0A0D9VN14_9ORYZ
MATASGDERRMGGRRRKRLLFAMETKSTDGWKYLVLSIDVKHMFHESDDCGSEPRLVADFGPQKLDRLDFTVVGSNVVAVSSCKRTLLYDVDAENSSVSAGPELGYDLAGGAVLIPLGNRVYAIGRGPSWMISPSFQALTPGRWRTLPPPPQELCRVVYESLGGWMGGGTHVWLSAPGKGTFAFDTQANAGLGAPYPGTVPDLDRLCFGICSTRRHRNFLCAFDLPTANNSRPPVIRYVWPATYPHEYYDGCYSPLLLRPSLAYLGRGRFCITWTMGTEFDRNSFARRFALLLIAVQLSPHRPHCHSSGKLRLVKRRLRCYNMDANGREAYVLNPDLLFFIPLEAGVLYASANTPAGHPQALIPSDGKRRRWSWRSLPKPPRELWGRAFRGWQGVGTHIWMSTPDRGTYSFDTTAHSWRKEGEWELPFMGRALFLHHLCFGICPHLLCLCAFDLPKSGTHEPVTPRYVWPASFPHDAGCLLITPGNLSYLGDGNFCIAWTMAIEFEYNGALRSPSSSPGTRISSALSIARCDATTCHPMDEMPTCFSLPYLPPPTLPERTTSPVPSPGALIIYGGDGSLDVFVKSQEADMSKPGKWLTARDAAGKDCCYRMSRRRRKAFLLQPSLCRYGPRKYEIVRFRPVSVSYYSASIHVQCISYYSFAFKVVIVLERSAYFMTGLVINNM